MQTKISRFYLFVIAATFLVVGFIFAVKFSASPALAFNPLDFTATQNGATPTTQDSRGGNNPATFSITNNTPSGGAAMYWSSSSNVTWLNITPSCRGTTGCGTTGSLAAGTSDTVTALPNTTNLSPSTYSATITINGWQDAAKTIPANPASSTVTVSYIVNTPPPCNIAVTSSYDGSAGTLPPSGFTYTLTGPTTINGTNQTGGSPWPVTPGSNYTIAATPTSGSVAVNGYTPSSNQTCATSGGTITFNVAFLDTPPGPPSPPPTAQNTSINSAVVCTHVLISWGAATGATGYDLYRSQTNGGPSDYLTGGNPWMNVGNVTSKDYIPTAPDPGYYYWVQAYNAGGLGTLSSATAKVAATPCISDFSASNKVLTKVNNVNYPFTSPLGCIGNQSGTLPNTIRAGDKTSWSINVCNQGNLNANTVTLTDTLTDLTPVAGTYVITTSPPTVVNSITPVLTGSCATGSCVLTFSIASIPQHTNAIITFDATTTIPTGVTQTLNRFRNQAQFTWHTASADDNQGCTGTGSGSTNPCVLPDPGFIVFFNGPKAPTQTEVNP